MRQVIITLLAIIVIVGCNKNSSTPSNETTATIQVVFPDSHSYTYTNSSAPYNGNSYEYLYSPYDTIASNPINYIVYTAAQVATPFQAAAPAYYTITFNDIVAPVNGLAQGAIINTLPYFNYTNFTIDSATSNRIFLNNVINIQDTTYAYNKMVISSSFSDTTHTTYSGTIHVDLYPKWYIVANYPIAVLYQPSSPISIDFKVTNIGYY